MNYKIKKYVIALLCVAFLSACSHGEQDSTSLTDQDLSGTWLHTQYETTYDKNTGAYLFTSVFEATLIIADDPVSGLLYYECWDVAGTGDTGYKTDTHLYIDFNTRAFRSIATNVLQTDVEFGLEYATDPGRVIDRHYRLEKLTSSVDVDKGVFTLNGPITIAETDTVCVSRQSSDAGADKIFDLSIPYNNDYLEMRLYVTPGLSVGVHNYTPFAIGAEILAFSIASGSSNFISVTGSNVMAPNSVTITITDSTDSIIAGTYFYIGLDDENYSGSFSMDITF